MSQPTTPRFPDRAIAVTPSDTTFLSPSTIYVGSGGNVVVEPVVGGNTITFTNAPSGATIPVRVRRVLAATTATDLVAVS